MSTDIVQVAISADVSGLLAGLKAASGATESASAGMRDSLGRFVRTSAEAGVAAKEFAREAKEMGGSAHEAGGHVGKLSEIIREYGQSQRTEGRMGAFLARDLVGMAVPTTPRRGIGQLQSDAHR